MRHPLSKALLVWYAANARDLPWRRTRDPYAIWVSEIMLQQTRVEAVLPYYERWMGRFPDVQSLAAASQEEVLALWEGLGYYSRARHLHRAAQVLVAEHGGQLPVTAAELERLPGIGRYTAAAIATFAFGADAIALDGNLRRILSRLFDLPLDPRTPEGEQRLLAQAADLLPRGRASEFNQALMDLGTTICTPRSPDCLHCPLAQACLARARRTQAQRPVRARRRPIPHRTVAAAVLRRNGDVLVGRRPEGGLLGGLWEFPGGKQESDETLKACLRRELREELGVKVVVGEEIAAFENTYTHFRVTVHAFECRLASGEPRPLDHSQIRWTPIARLGRLPMGKVDRAIARLIASAQGGESG
jgi:A/G-specific adenine glycosylase